MKVFVKIHNEAERVARLAGLFALRCGMSAEMARDIRIAALLHDIGKQKIPERILNKPGSLTTEEFEIVKAHTLLGTEMLSNIRGSLGAVIQNVCRYHHERADGQGYWGKRLGDLPDYVQIVAICDVYAALTSERVYKEAWSPEHALIYIRSQAGTQFDLASARMFVELGAGML